MATNQEQHPSPWWYKLSRHEYVHQHKIRRHGTNGQQTQTGYFNPNGKCTKPKCSDHRFRNRCAFRCRENNISMNTHKQNNTEAMWMRCRPLARLRSASPPVSCRQWGADMLRFHLMLKREHVAPSASRHPEWASRKARRMRLAAAQLLWPGGDMVNPPPSSPARSIPLQLPSAVAAATTP